MQKKLLYASMATLLLATASMTAMTFKTRAAPTLAKKKNFIHSVYFWTKAGASEQEKAELGKGIESLRKIKLIRQMHIGKPAGTPRNVVDNTYTYAVVMYFADSAAQQAYQVHPLHQHFVDNYKKYWEKVVVYDCVAE